MNIQYEPRPWSLCSCHMVRTRADLSIHLAAVGSSSEKRTPGRVVGMVPNSPRMSSGASGFGSNVSSCAGPPDR